MPLLPPAPVVGRPRRTWSWGEMALGFLLFLIGVRLGSLLVSNEDLQQDNGTARAGHPNEDPALGGALDEPAQRTTGQVKKDRTLHETDKKDAVDDEEPVTKAAALLASPTEEETLTPKANEANPRGSSVAERVHGIRCPPPDPNIQNLQIPLKHLPRKKKTSVAEKYDRRAHNCAKDGVWNRVTFEDHHKILQGIVRLGQIRDKAFVLDWGSGCGHSLQWLFEEHRVTGVGIDVSSKTIAYATANTTREDLHCVADGTKLMWLPASTFDNALSFGSIYHVYNRTLFCHVLRQLVRLIKVGGTVYNGWTENAEYKRAHLQICLADLPVKFTVFEEGVEFGNVKIFPLKSQQDVPNTYSLVIEKVGEAPNEQFLLENIPISCDTHRCDPVARKPRFTSQQQQKHTNEDVPTESHADDQQQQQQQQHQREERRTLAVDVAGGSSDDLPTCPPYDKGIDDLQIPLEHLPRGKKTSVAQKYDRRAHGCATEGIWHRVTFEDHQKILRGIARVAGIKSEGRLFDWGCGCGHKLSFLTKEFNTRGLGIDVSNKTIEYAVANTSSKNRFCVADGTRLEWIPDNTFDVAFSFGSIYHVYNKTKFCSVLRDLVRIVKPGGRVYNGWTENREFNRKDTEPCVNQGTTTPHNVQLIAEAELFKDVATFPLKAQRKKPNTYSVLIRKAG